MHYDLLKCGCQLANSISNYNLIILVKLPTANYNNFKFSLVKMSNKKLNIAIISCGGTISMEPDERGILQPVKNIDEIIEGINLTSLKNKIEIPKDKRIELFKHDSSDLNHNHWNEIIKTIEKLQKDSDGILIFHGTDTMAYSATAVGLALSQKLKVPVVFTGAQSSLEETGNDGAPNIERSLLILNQAARDGIIECMVFFGDKAYRGVNTLKRSESEYDAFDSPSTHPLYLTTGLGTKMFLRGRGIKDIESSKKRVKVNLQNKFSDGVVVLSVIPGLEADFLMSVAKDKSTKAIILYSLGAGNIPALPGKYNLTPSILKITKDLKKPVIVASPFVGGSTNMEVYMPGILAKEAGAINAGKMTAEATIVKTRLLLAQPQYAKSLEELKTALAIDFAGETATEFSS